MSACDWRVVAALVIFVAILLLVRAIHRPRMRDRLWLRQFAQRKYSPRSDKNS